jgi:hypothetical protein
MICQECLDALVQPVGRAEEQIALQVEALDLGAMRGKQCLILARTVERGAEFSSVEPEFDRLDVRGAQREGRAADDSERPR